MFLVLSYQSKIAGGSLDVGVDYYVYGKLSNDNIYGKLLNDNVYGKLSNVFIYTRNCEIPLYC